MVALVTTILLALGGIAALYFEQPALLAIAVGAPLAGWLVLKDPVQTFCVGIVFSGWAISLGRVGLPITPYKLVIFSLVGVLTLKTILGYRPVALPLWFSLLFTSLIGLFTISELGSELLGIGALLNLISVFVIAFYGWQVLVDVAALRSLATAVALGQLWGAAVVWREVGWAALAGQGTLRAGGLSGEPNVAGSLAMVWFFIGLPVIFDRSNEMWRRLVGLASVPAFVYVVFGTASRGVTAAAVAGLIAFVGLRVNSFGNLLKSVGFVGILLVAAYTLAPKTYVTRMQATVVIDEQTGTIEKTSDSGRRELAETSLRLISQRPLLGAGLYGSAAARTRIGGVGTTTHSTFLAMADSYGLIALAIFLLALAKVALMNAQLILRAPLPLRDYGVGLGAAFFAALVFSVSNPEIIDKNLWFLIAFICAAQGRALPNARADAALAADDNQRNAVTSF